jgi:DNA polymerase-3 subunit gamma/tau
MENYIVSARKYRPATFDTVVGQKAITNTLKNAIKNHYLAQAYLFTGPRGVGKTTSARIFAKTINCLNLDLESNPDVIEPCNECESCRSFSENASFNIMELDAASNNSVDDIRRLVEQVRIPPQVGKYKVYIIDEVHMLSPAAFNAFLKTLEEPPPYVKFILATTEKHKIIPTILSRCQVFDFKRISNADIVEYLQFVAGQEGVNADEEALHLIAQKADGAMRDALSIFDQLVSFTTGNITYQSVVDNLHVLDYDYFFQISDLFLSHDITAVLLILNDIIERGFDGQHFIIGFGQHLRNLLISQDSKTINLLETSAAIKKRYYESASHFSAAFLLKALDLNAQCDTQYKTSNNKRLLIELSLMQMVALGSGIEMKEDKQLIPAMPLKKKVIPPAPQPKKEIPKPPVEKVSPIDADTLPPQKENTTDKVVGSSSNSPVLEDKKLTSDKIVKEEPKSKPKPVSYSPQSMGLGVSIKDEGNNNQQELNPDAYMLGKEDIADAFAQEKLDVVFSEFLEGIKKNQGLYNTLKKNKVSIISENTIELKVYNEAQKSVLNEKKFELMKLLRTRLNNYKLKAEVRIVENGNNLTVMKPAERYSAMAKKNPNLNKLKDSLNLELDF